jgi:hypothetical protein
VLSILASVASYNGKIDTCFIQADVDVVKIEVHLSQTTGKFVAFAGGYAQPTKVFSCQNLNPKK